jgi:hypothetical protein
MDIPNSEFYRDQKPGMLNLEAMVRAGVIHVSFWKTTLTGSFVAGDTCRVNVLDDGYGHLDREAVWRVIGSSRNRSKVLLEPVSRTQSTSATPRT